MQYTTLENVSESKNDRALLADPWPIDYPNATGETPCIEEFLPLDSTSVLLWMLYLYQNTTGDKELTETYSPILQRYADYCARYGLCK